MARVPSTFRQITRAIKAARAGGVDIARIEIDRAGKIVIIMVAGAAQIGIAEENEWDRD
jgi:hypothetical protein